MLTAGKRISTLRKNLGITQSQLASMLKSTQAQVSAYETNIRMPTEKRLKEISTFLKTTAYYLRYGVEHKDEKIEFVKDLEFIKERILVISNRLNLLEDSLEDSIKKKAVQHEQGVDLHL